MQIQWLYAYVANWLTLEWSSSLSSINSYLAFYIILFPWDVQIITCSLYDNEMVLLR